MERQKAAKGKESLTKWHFGLSFSRFERHTAMQLTMLKSKIHQATVTGVFRNYSGSLTIDSDLMEEAGLLPHEKILVANLDNGERFETYAIPGTPGSREIEINGAASHKGKVGDRIIILSFVTMDAREAETWTPKILILGDDNQVVQPNLA